MTLRIYLGGAVGRYFEPDHVLSVIRLLHRREVVEYSPRFNDAAVDRARSQSATEFLEWRDRDGNPADVLLQIDSDVVFNAADAIRICEMAVERDIVGGVYVTRGKGDLCYPTSLLHNERRVDYASAAKPAPALYVAGGFVATHRRVFERLAQDTERMPLLNAGEPHGHFYPFYLPTWTEGENGLFYLSEDWALCYRARQAGFGVWVDPSVRLLHLGQHSYRMEDMLTEAVPEQWIALTRHRGGKYTRESLTDPVTA